MTGNKGKRMTVCISVHRVYIICVLYVMFLDYIHVLYNRKVMKHKTKQGKAAEKD